MAEARRVLNTAYTFLMRYLAKVILSSKLFQFAVFSVGEHFVQSLHISFTQCAIITFTSVNILYISSNYLYSLCSVRHSPSIFITGI